MGETVSSPKLELKHDGSHRKSGTPYCKDEENALGELAAKDQVEGLLLSGGPTHSRQAGEFLLDGDLFRD